MAMGPLALLLSQCDTTAGKTPEGKERNLGYSSDVVTYHGDLR